jgi:hypothetical protein
MVGIYAKIKNGFNWIKNHIFKPVVNTVKKVVHSPFVKKLVGFATPLLNTVAPGLGTGISTGFNIADQVLSDADRGGVQGVIEKGMDGGYNQQLSGVPGLNKVMQSMTLARRPSELNPLIQLKNDSAIVPRNRSYVEEIDTPD